MAHNLDILMFGKNSGLNGLQAAGENKTLTHSRKFKKICGIFNG